MSWQDRFTAPRMSLPEHAEDAPDRYVLTSNDTGVTEVYAWDRARGQRRQVTDRPHGTSLCAISPDGEHIYVFTDTDGDEFGQWQQTPFSGGPLTPLMADATDGYPAGLALARDILALGTMTDDGVEVRYGRVGEPSTVIYRHAEEAHVAGLSADGALIFIEHSEHGDSLHPALRVLDASGRTVAELSDGPGRGLTVADVSDRDGDNRAIVIHERDDRRGLLIWDPTDGSQVPVPAPAPGDLTGLWLPDGQSILVVAENRGRTSLVTVRADGSCVEHPLPPGTISDVSVRPDGRIDLHRSSSEQPPEVISVDGSVLIAPDGPVAPSSQPVIDVDVVGPAGPIHALLTVPADAPAPHAGVVLVHGGPMWHDRDVFDPVVAAFVDSGYAVVEVNYRGSTGYGASYQDAIIGRPGLTELDDIAAVTDHLVATGVLDGSRLLLSGASWGGYLTLLGLGTQPQRWAAGVASVPVADYVQAYADEMESLRATDRALFGGSPEDVPDAYAASSPITYCDAVNVPLLVIAGVNDPRCPLAQIENYLARMRERGHPCQEYRYDAGHGSLVVAERIRQMQVELDFAAATVPARR